jgi:hypothetical protein
MPVHVDKTRNEEKERNMELLTSQDEGNVICPNANFIKLFALLKEDMLCKYEIWQICPYC